MATLTIYYHTIMANTAHETLLAPNTVDFIHLLPQNKDQTNRLREPG